MNDLLQLRSGNSKPTQNGTLPIPSNSPLAHFLKSLPASAYAADTPRTSMDALSPGGSPLNTTKAGERKVFSSSSSSAMPASLPTLLALSNPNLSSNFPSLAFTSNNASSTNTNNNTSGKSGKNKKKRRVSELVVDTIPLNDVRRNYPRLLEMIFNRSQAEDNYNKLLSMCALSKQGEDNAFTFIASAVEKENHFGPIYSEIHSIDAAARYLSTHFCCIPDSIFVIVDCKFYKRAPGGESEIHCNFSFSGSKVYKVIVEDCDESYDMGGAVLGLQTLAQVAMEREYLAQEFATAGLEEGEIGDERDSDGQGEALESTIDSEDNDNAMVIARTGTADSMDNHSSASSSNHATSGSNSNNSSNNSSEKISSKISSYYNAEKRKVFVVGETEIHTNIKQGEDPFMPPAYDQLLIATKKTKFRVGERLPVSRSFSTNGKIIFLLNQDKKVEKMELLFSAKMAFQSSRYIKGGNHGSEV